MEEPLPDSAHQKPIETSTFFEAEWEQQSLPSSLIVKT